MTAFFPPRYLVTLCCPLLLARSPLAQAQDASRMPVRVLVMDEKVRPVSDTPISLRFESARPGARASKQERSKSTVTLDCVTNAAGACSLKAPLSVGSAAADRNTVALVGTLERLGDRQALGLPINQRLPGPIPRGRQVMLAVTLGTDGTVSVRHFLTELTASEIAPRVQESGESTDEEMAVSSLKNPRLPAYQRTRDPDNHGYIVAFTGRKTGKVRYELRADVTSEKTTELQRSDKVTPVPPAEASIGRHTWRLPGVRVRVDPIHAPHPAIGSPGHGQARHVIGAREVFAYRLTAAQVDAMMAGYTEGSTTVLALDTGRKNGGHLLPIPLADMRAVMVRRAELASLAGVKRAMRAGTPDTSPRPTSSK